MDNYDVFGDLNEMCNNNALGKLKELSAELPANIDDPDVDAMLNAMENSPRSNVDFSPSTSKKTKSKAPNQSPVKHISEKRAKPKTQSLPENEQVARRTRSSITRRQAATVTQKPDETEAQSNPKPKGRQGRGRKKQNLPRAASETTEVCTSSSVLSADNVENTECIDITHEIPDVLPARCRRNKRGTPFDVMRARRNYIAEIAARSSNVDYVDLVSSPIPHIEGVISVDSDEEKEQTKDTPENSFSLIKKNDSHECSFDEDNPEISVKIRWMGGNPEIFKLRKYQKFLHIFKQLAEREKNELDTLVFNIQNKIISQEDTPASIDYKIYQFIDGRVLAGCFAGPIKKRDANKITLKVQSDEWKRPLKVDIAKTDHFKILYIKCAEELNIPYERINLSFDGDHLEYNATPGDFELESGEAIDLRIKK